MTLTIILGTGAFVFLAVVAVGQRYYGHRGGLAIPAGFIAGAIMVFLAFSARANEYPVTVDRFVDSDTLDVTARTDFPVTQFAEVRVRLYCVNSPESDTPEGQALNAEVEALGLSHGVIDPYKRDAFGRWLAFFRPAGWDISLNEWLYRRGVPLYARLTRAERAECERRLGVAP